MQSGWEGFFGSLAGIAIGFAVLILPYLMGILGAGDVKLLMGIGAWIGGHGTALVALFGTPTQVLIALSVRVPKETAGNGPQENVRKLLLELIK